jgi:hypothetical protein
MPRFDVSVTRDTYEVALHVIVEADFRWQAEQVAQERVKANWPADAHVGYVRYGIYGTLELEEGDGGEAQTQA